jgi:NAD(P)-dependent dehydrogenase (short-subunit alcohol dehydrogenase family)
VVVTGAGSGIGRAIALAFAAEGAELVAADLDLSSARQTCEDVTARGGAALPYQVDVAVAAEMEPGTYRRPDGCAASRSPRSRARWSRSTCSVRL